VIINLSPDRNTRTTRFGLSFDTALVWVFVEDRSTGPQIHSQSRTAANREPQKRF